MKRKFFKLAVICLVFTMQNLIAVCHECNSNEGLLSALGNKTYITPNQIAFYDSKIYVQVEENVLAVSAIYSDLNGFYINENQLFGLCPPHTWKCKTCGTCNDFEHYNCLGCGREME